MVATIAAGTSAGYYLAQSEYYLGGGSEPQGTWIAVGDGLGIKQGSAVEREAFKRLHAAIGLDGRTLLSNGGKRIDRVPGYDMTFSAPKSVSVLWALGDQKLREEIEVVQAEAVSAVIDLIKRNAAFSRRGNGGARSEATSLSVAAFQHGEARPTEHADGRVFADPQLHTHAVILNLARRADGTVGTLDGRRLFAWKMAAGATYHLALASGLQRLGLEIAKIGKNGVFEVAGVHAGLSNYFSARRGEIEIELEAAGLTSSAAPALAGAITKASRAVKEVASGKDRCAYWRDVAAELGYEAAGVIESARSAGKRSAVAQDTKAPGRAIEKYFDHVPDQLTQTESVFERRQLVAAVAAALVGSGASVERAEIEVARLIDTGQVVQLGSDAIGEKRYSTSAMIRIEREVLALARTLATKQMPQPNRLDVDHLVGRYRLSDEQARAASVATSGSAITVIEGAAGSGKTTALRPIVAAYRIAGYRIIGAATAWRIAHQLRDDLKIEARATDAWLAGRSAGHPFLDDKTLLVVDEAGQLSSRQMHAVLSEVAHAGAKVLLVGDRRQLQPIGAGGALSIVARAADFAQVNRIVRQRTEWQREAVMALSDGRTRDAIVAYAERGHTCCTRPRRVLAPNSYDKRLSRA